MCSSLLAQTWFIKSSIVLLLAFQKGKGVAQGIQRYSHCLIVFLVVSLHIKNLTYWVSYSCDTCFWYAQIDYLGHHEAKFHLTSLFIEIFCQNYAFIKFQYSEFLPFSLPLLQNLMTSTITNLSKVGCGRNANWPIAHILSKTVAQNQPTIIL